MRLIAQKAKFVCVLLTVILSGSLFTGVVFADDEPKTVPERDEQPKKLGTANTETVGQSNSAASERDNGTRKGQLIFAMDELLRF